MGIFIYICFVLLYGYGVYLTNKKNYSETCSVLGLLFMIFQLLIVLPNMDVPYQGYPLEEYSNVFLYYVGVLFYYIGYFLWSIIAIILVYTYLFIKIKKEKKAITIKNEDNMKQDYNKNQTKIFCTKCGNEINNEWEFCRHCGSKIERG